MSMDFSIQEHWSGLPFPSLGDLRDPGIEPGYPTFQAVSLSSETSGRAPLVCILYSNNKTPQIRRKLTT